MIKYRFALNAKGILIDIRNLERSELSKEDKFFSIDFRQLLIPRLGNIKTKHFAHKANVDILGSRETYLHALGKKIFYDEYSSCLLNKIPFYLNYTIQKYCNRLQKEYNITCKLKPEIGRFDLSKYFTEILMEKKTDDFRPDILLLNPETKEKIYIEIAVTHMLSDKKKHSEHRIIEFLILDEDDAAKLIEFKNGSENKVRYCNFKEKPIIKPFCTMGNCLKEFNLFSVDNNGKSHLTILSEKQIQLTINKYRSNTVWNILEQSEINKEEEDYRGQGIKDVFIRYLVKAYKENVKIKNCYLCRYHGENTFEDYLIEGNPIFCKFLRITCGSNDAVECQFFKVERSYIS